MARDTRRPASSRRLGAAGASLVNALAELAVRFARPPAAVTAGRVHVRDGLNVQELLNSFVIASLPCWLLGTWNLGVQTSGALLRFGFEAPAGWRGWLLGAVGIATDPNDPLACFVLGLLYFVPIFAVALATGALWEALFAKLRRRPVDHGMLSVAWLLSLIVPATLQPWETVLGMSFAMVVGKGIYGGTGRYIVSPAILGLAFLVFSYANVIYGPGAWIPVPGYDDPTTIELAVEEGGVAALTAVGYSRPELFLGLQPGPIGVTSILGCLLGAVYLVLAGTASARIMLGSVVGMIGTVWLLNAFGPADDPMFRVPWTWHALIGGWAFGTVFLATDPVAAATTNVGRWAFGILVGALTIVVRVTNPSYYEGVMFAILLASIFAPVIDHAVVAANISRRRRRLQGVAGGS